MCKRKARAPAIVVAVAAFAAAVPPATAITKAHAFRPRFRGLADRQRDTLWTYYMYLVYRVMNDNSSKSQQGRFRN